MPTKILNYLTYCEFRPLCKNCFLLRDSRLMIFLFLGSCIFPLIISTYPFKNHSFVALCKHNLDFQWKVCLSSKILEIFLSKKHSVYQQACLCFCFLKQLATWLDCCRVCYENKLCSHLNKSSNSFFFNKDARVCTYCVCLYTYTLLFLSLVF